MSVFRPLLLVLSALPCLAATFGTVVPHAQPLADLVIDEARRRLYVVNTSSNTVEVYATNVNPPRLTNAIKTNATPLSLAHVAQTPSRYLYVACYDELYSRYHRPEFRQLLVRLQTAGRQTPGRGRRFQWQGPCHHRRHRDRGRSADYLRSVTGKTQPVSVAPPAPGRAHPASAQRHHVPGRKEPPADLAGRQS